VRNPIHQRAVGDVLNKPLESTFVVIEEVPTDDWDWGG